MEALFARAGVETISAYLIVVLGGNTTPSAEDLKDILRAVGAEVDDGRIEFLLSEVESDVVRLIVTVGREKLGYKVEKEEKVEENEESDDDAFRDKFHRSLPKVSGSDSDFDTDFDTDCETDCEA